MDDQEKLLETMDIDETNFESLDTKRDESMDIYGPMDVDAASLQQDWSQWEGFVRAVNNLPAQIQDILFDPSTAYSIMDICTEARLTGSQSQELTKVIRDVLIANVFLGDMPSLISQKLDITVESANQITQKIIAELFMPAIEEIKNVQREKFKNRIGQTKNAQSPQTPASYPRQPASPTYSNETTQQGNVVDLRNRGN